MTNHLPNLQLNTSTGAQPAPPASLSNLTGPSIPRWTILGVFSSVAKFSTVSLGLITGATQWEKTGTAPWQISDPPRATPVSDTLSRLIPSAGPWVASSSKLSAPGSSSLPTPNPSSAGIPELVPPSSTGEQPAKGPATSQAVTSLTTTEKLRDSLKALESYLKKMGAKPPAINLASPEEALDTVKAFGDSVLTLGPATTGKNEAIYMLWAVQTLGASEQSVDLFYKSIPGWKAQLDAPEPTPFDTRKHSKLYLTDEKIAEYSSGPYNPKNEDPVSNTSETSQVSPTNAPYAELQSLAQQASQPPMLQRPDLSQTPGAIYATMKDSVKDAVLPSLSSLDLVIATNGGQIPQKDFGNLKGLLGTLSDYRQAITLIDPGSPFVSIISEQITGWKRDPKEMLTAAKQREADYQRALPELQPLLKTLLDDISAGLKAAGQGVPDRELSTIPSAVDTVLKFEAAVGRIAPQSNHVALLRDLAIGLWTNPKDQVDGLKAFLGVKDKPSPASKPPPPTSNTDLPEPPLPGAELEEPPVPTKTPAKTPARGKR